MAQETPSGKLVPFALSEDHKPDRAEEKERILSKGGAVEPIEHMRGKFVGPARVWRQRQTLGGLAVSRAFGDIAMAPVGVTSEPEVRRFELGDKDRFIVLGSDGIWDHMTEQQVVDVAAKYEDATAAATAVANEARRLWTVNGQGYIDDICALVVKL